LFGASGATSDRRKGFHLLPDVLKSLIGCLGSSDLTLGIFGGPRKTGVDTSLGLPTLHLGRYEDDISLALLYSAADVVVAPYLEDNLPFVVLEALACGTPLAAFAAGGIPDAVEHRQNGFLAPVGDVAELGRGIAWVLSDASRLDELRRAARATAEARFDLVDCVRRFKDLFAEIAARKISEGTSA
jgi:glycosyltransferase involved in cell wall biosynthesis